MQPRNTKAKIRIVSTRISSEEWEALCETMKCLKVDNVSDLIREGLKRVAAPLALFETTSAEGGAAQVHASHGSGS